MKKILAITVAFGMLAFAGSALADTYYESYEGSQFISQHSPNYWFEFDIDLDNNGATNSSLAFTNDATGFEYWNNEQLGSVQVALDLFSTDSQPELFDMDVNIYWSVADFTETVTFNATRSNGGHFYYTYDFTQAQIDGWEVGGWGSVTIDAYNIPGGHNYNDFVINRVAMTASNAPVPEPATMLLFGAGLAGLVGYSRKCSKKS